MKINKKQLLYSFFYLIFLIAIILIHNFGFDDLLATTVDEATELGTYNMLFTLLIQFLMWIFVAMFLFLIWGSMLKTLEPKMTKTVINTLRVLGRIIIIPFCIIAFLNNFPGFQGTLLGISAILGTAIGFASTTTMGNFLAGLYIMATRPFLIGDYIILPDSKVEGRIKEITVNYTKMTLPTGNQLLVSNSKFLGQSIINTRTTEDQLIVRKDDARRFVYPLMWGANSDEKHIWSVEAIEKTGEQFKTRLCNPITWFIYSRNRLDRTYQINLTSNSAGKLLDLTGEFLTELTKNYDEVKEKYRPPLA